MVRINAADLLATTHWDALEHAMGPAHDVPGILTTLLDADQRVRSRALGELYGLVHHQETLYTATAPAALYVAAILPDARTRWSVDKRPRDFPGPMLAELLGWLDSVANEADDEAAAMSRRIGLPLEDHPPFVQIRGIRPQLYCAVAAFLSDPDTHVRQAAISACIPLLDDPRLCHHRAPLIPLLRETLAASTLRQYRERAIEALTAWGEDTTELAAQQEVFDPHAARRASSPWPDAPRFGDATDPPF